jgi:hypothetical protein
MLVVVAAMAFTTRLAGAQTVANGPYYATPSWDQKLDPSVRFIVLANWNSDAVLDRETGIVWQRTPAGGSVSWYTASRNTCAQSKTGGRSGWRLPTLQELMSIMEPTLFGNPVNSDPPLAIGHPFLGVTNNAHFWTATTDDQQPGNAFAIGWQVPATTPPNLAYNTTPVAKTSGSGAWCVRGGLLAAAQ